MKGAVSGGRLFLLLHLAAVLGMIALAATLLAGRFTDRRQRIADDREEVQRIEGINRRTAALARQIAGRGDPFLSATDERLGSADLQATLQDLTRSGGATLLSVRGVPAPRRPDLRIVAAKLEVEGPLDRVDAVVKAVEGHVPLLWIDAAVIRDAGNGQEPGVLLHAELQVQAALAPRAAPAAGIIGGLRP